MADRFDWERALRSSPGIHPTTRLVLYALGTYMGPKGTAWPTQRTLAEATGLTDRAVRDHLSKAREAGWIERTRQGRGVGPSGGMASEYEARIPDLSTGTTVPPEEPSTGTTVPPEPKSQPEPHAHQPEPHDRSAGTTVPPNMQEHVEHCSSSEQIPDDIRTAARREIRAKRARGEEILNEHGLFTAICRQLVDAQRIDDTLDNDDAERQAHDLERMAESYRSLGRNRAHLVTTEADLRAELAGDLGVLRFPQMLDEALDAWNDARTVHAAPTGGSP